MSHFYTRRAATEGHRPFRKCCDCCSSRCECCRCRCSREEFNITVDRRRLLTIRMNSVPQVVEPNLCQLLTDLSDSDNVSDGHVSAARCALCGARGVLCLHFCRVFKKMFNGWKDPQLYTCPRGSFAIPLQDGPSLVLKSMLILFFLFGLLLLPVCKK